MQLAVSHFPAPFVVQRPGTQLVSHETQAPLTKANPEAQAEQLIAKLLTVHVAQFETGLVVDPPYIL